MSKTTFKHVLQQALELEPEEQLHLAEELTGRIRILIAERKSTQERDLEDTILTQTELAQLLRALAHTRKESGRSIRADRANRVVDGLSIGDLGRGHKHLDHGLIHDDRNDVIVVQALDGEDRRVLGVLNLVALHRFRRTSEGPRSIGDCRRSTGRTGSCCRGFGTFRG